jgi:hypothetical protein
MTRTLTLSKLAKLGHVVARKGSVENDSVARSGVAGQDPEEAGR